LQCNLGVFGAAARGHLREAGYLAEIPFERRRDGAGNGLRGALIGEKYLRYVPNTDHSLKGSDAGDSILAFYHSIAAGQPRLKLS
jgi:PhoPQ-activated pathogenicity-related protein